MAHENPSLVWFRLDLRLSDNPALAAAIERGQPVLPVYIWAPDEEGEWSPGSASRYWLHHSLESLDRDLRALGSRLILREGGSLACLKQLADQTGAGAVFWNRRYEPALVERDRKVETELQARGCLVKTFNSSLLFEPWSVRTRTGGPFRVFTPFWKSCLLSPLRPESPLPSPRSLPGCSRRMESRPLDSLRLKPRVDWASGIRAAWKPGEASALVRLNRFLDRCLEGYSQTRDLPKDPCTSTLSPHLHFGEIGPRQIWDAVGKALEGSGELRGSMIRQGFLRQLGWREFAHHLLFHFPGTPEAPLRAQFEHFGWKDDAVQLERWSRGQTGYPLVDAGMRQLWQTGWMHNRVRMIAASFLVKHLLVSWQAGARWFWDTLVDADLANNTLGWQWVAGCGADAAPFFRIFNPVSQGIKFDPCGAYVRRWVPELAPLPDAWIHQPWAAPPDVLEGAGIRLDLNYPSPLVGLQEGRERALAAYARMRRRSRRP